MPPASLPIPADRRWFCQTSWCPSAPGQRAVGDGLVAEGLGMASPAPHPEAPFLGWINIAQPQHLAISPYGLARFGGELPTGTAPPSPALYSAGGRSRRAALLAPAWRRPWQCCYFVTGQFSDACRDAATS